MTKARFASRRKRWRASTIRPATRPGDGRIGLLLAELAPARSTQILSRPRGYAESRVVCGAHKQSAIDAGLMNAAALVAALHGSPEFRIAMEAARGELDAATVVGVTPEAKACAVEAAALQSGY